MAPELNRAVQYVRMSTDMQKYSIENQSDVIALYAARRGLTIVRSYEDAGRSGLRFDTRDALKALIEDVVSGRADFKVILVYDVSRWGRFQDADEGAYYEFVCKKAGVTVEYCAEPFENDSGLMATLFKNIKRLMAGEYSRELSKKVFASHVRLAYLGFNQGGTPVYGLRRLLIDNQNRPKFILANGQRKSLHDDRVILVPGSEQEIQTVRKIFQMYVVEGLTHKGIARSLNQQGLLTKRGCQWSGAGIRNLLDNRKLSGNFVYNRTSLKLQSRRVRNPEGKWIQAKDVIEPLIEPQMFAAAQSRLAIPSKFSDADLLNYLTAAWCKNGYLSIRAMKRVPGTPSQNTYLARFGSLANAYRLVGYKPTHAYRFAQIDILLRNIERNTICELTSSMERKGRTIRTTAEGFLSVEGKITVLPVVIPFTKTKTGRPGWWFYFGRWGRADVILLVRLTNANMEVLDYHLLPYPVFSGASFRFTDENLSALSAYRPVSSEGMADILCAKFLQNFPAVSALDEAADV